MSRILYRLRFWRLLATVAGAIGRWAQAGHDRSHATPDPGCRACKERCLEDHEDSYDAWLAATFDGPRIRR